MTKPKTPTEKQILQEIEGELAGVPTFTPASPTINPLSKDVQNSLFPQGTLKVIASDGFLAYNVVDGAVYTQTTNLYTVPQGKVFLFVGGICDNNYSGGTAIGPGNKATGVFNIGLNILTNSQCFFGNQIEMPSGKEFFQQSPQEFNPHVPLTLFQGQTIDLFIDLETGISGDGVFLNLQYFIFGYEIDA